MNNGQIHTKFQVIRYVVSSAEKSELGAIFHNVQTTIPLSTILKELGHKQPPTPLETEGSTALGIVNSTVKQKNKNQWT